MHRFYLPNAATSNEDLTLEGREAHHALHVLRVRRGDRIALADGAGGDFSCEVRETGKHTLTLHVLQKSSVPRLPCRVVLAQGLTKGKTMDVIAQKATELGVARVIPIISERTVARVDEESTEAKVEKWKLIAIDALKQSGSAWLPQIDPPVTPATFLSQGERFDLSLVATLQDDGQHPRNHFSEFRREQRREPGRVCLWIGPEGDFTPAEIHAIKSAGSLPITLGPLVLRSETAAIYALAIVNYELQDRG